MEREPEKMIIQLELHTLGLRQLHRAIYEVADLLAHYELRGCPFTLLVGPSTAELGLVDAGSAPPPQEPRPAGPKG